jgi:Type II secretion system (T2SS), protein M
VKVRERLIVAAVGALVVIGAVWMLLVSPERKQASSLSAQIATGQSALISAQASLTTARSVAAGYPGDVRALAQVTAAVPASLDEPSVITTITKLAGTKVDVHEIGVSTGLDPSTAASSLTLSFTFNATYASMRSFLLALDRLTNTDGTNIAASGRLFTVSAISFTPQPPDKTQATVTAQAFAQGAFGATGATGPTGATGATDATATSAVTP